MYINRFLLLTVGVVLIFFPRDRELGGQFRSRLVPAPTSCGS